MSTDRTVDVAIGRVAAAALAKGVAPVVVAEDNLLVGPSRVDARRHAAARARHWGRVPSRELEGVLTEESKGAVCVALPPTRNGLLSFCRVCSMALELGREVHVLDLGTGAVVPGPIGLDPAPERVLDARQLARQRPPEGRCSSLEISLAATLWRLWCRPSPVAFSQLCEAASPQSPPLANLGRYHAGFFPRASERGLSLSRLDELILQQLSREWQTPTRVFVQAMSAGSALRAWVSHTGDSYVAARLLAWSRHSEGRFVEGRRESPPGDSEMLAWSFRWSTGGDAILSGLPDLESAPPVALGGAVAHDPRRPWVCRVSSAGVPRVRRPATRGSTLAPSMRTRGHV